MDKVSKRTSDFLLQLGENNTREWFHANKPRYEEAKNDFSNLVDNLIARIRRHTDLGSLEAKNCMYRIQRDIRFSPDKTPYNSHFSAVIAPDGKKTKQTPFFFRIKPNDPSLCLIGGGIWHTDGKQIAAIRQEIDYNGDELKSIINQPEFLNYFKKLEGETLKRPPKGYDKDHPYIDWLKMKQFMVWHPLSEEVYSSESFADYVLDVYQTLIPFLNFWDTVLLDVER